MSSNSTSLHKFGNCLLDSEKKVLWSGGQPVDLPLKAVALLSVLVEKGGEVVTKDEIWNTVWQDSFVEETNLTHNIYLLRKTLKELGEPELIQTVPRRGYRFSGEIMPSPNGDVTIETHSFTRTLVEELPAEVAMIGEQGRRWRLPVAIVAVLALIVIAAGVSIWRFGGSSAVTSATGVGSIAIVPLVSATDGTDDSALSLGFTDALRTSLGNLDGVRVVSAGSAGADQNAPSDPARLGRDLSVDSVIEGTLQRANGKIRVTLRLIRSADGRQIWSGSFDESEAEIFKLQDAMAFQTAAALSRDWRAVKPSTANRDAYAAYLRGRFFFDKRDRENYEKAIEEFTHAVNLDPAYALAYSGLADVYAMQANVSDSTRRRDELYERSRSMALKALAVDETSAAAHTSLAWIKRVRDWDWEGSEREFKRAIELDPNYANARQWYAFLLLGLGRMDESLAQMNKAVELEPLSTIILNNSITVYNYRGDLDVLPSIAEQVSRLDGSEPRRSWILSLAYSRNGQHAKVVEIGEAYLAGTGGKIESDYLAANLAIAYSRTGQAAKAAAILADLEAKARIDHETAFRLAQAYAELGNKDRAITLLKQCMKAHDDRMVWLKTEPRFESLRSDPRYQQMLRDMRL